MILRKIVFLIYLVALFAVRCDLKMQTQSSTVLDTKPVQITTDSHPKHHPDWSPDGTMIAYSLDNVATILNSYSINGDSLGRFGAISDEIAGKPAISPDGKKFVYHSATRNHLWVYSFEDHSEICLTPDDLHAGGPAWSADGEYIVYTSIADENYSLWIVPSGGGKAAKVAQKDGYAFIVPCWSPDSKEIVFSAYSWDAGTNNIWVVNIATGAICQLTSDKGYNSYPAWSPDGSKIAFVANRAGIQRGVWIIPAVGGEATILSEDIDRSLDLYWSPDGSKIAFFAYFGSTPFRGLCVFTAEGQYVNMLPLEDYMRYPIWLPDSHTLVGVSYKKIIGSEINYITLANNLTHSVTYPNEGQKDNYPSWSPDNNHIVFVRENNIQTIDDLESEPRSIAGSLQVIGNNPDLSPDGALLAYDSNGYIFLLSIKKGTTTRLITEDNYFLWHPTWSPDGKQLACCGNDSLYIFTIKSDCLVKDKAIPGYYNHLSWSANHPILGSQILADYQEIHRVYLISPEHQTVKEFLQNCEQPCWSPDGTQLAFVGPGEQIYVERIFFNVSE
jgi:Tol biopolymer transport system component